MATKIEWTDETWNPITGCTQISEGCQNCYAKRMANRLKGRCGYDADNPFKITQHPERLDQPLRWKKPRKIFVCSMGDLFHPEIRSDFIEVMFGIMSFLPQHTFLVLTKRPWQAEAFFRNRTLAQCRQQIYWYFDDGVGPTEEEVESSCGAWPLPNVWIGVTCETQARADERIPILLQIPAAVRYVSVEPMLGPIKLEHYFPEYDYRPTYEYFRIAYGLDSNKPVIVRSGLDWVICGGETGPGARPMHPDWVRSLRDQCQAAGVPFFFKSWGDWQDGSALDTNAKHMIVLNNGETVEPGHELSITQREKWQYLRACMMSRVGKKNAGRLLDGQQWNEYPAGVE